MCKMDGIPCPASKPPKDMQERVDKAKESAKQAGHVAGAKMA